MTPVPVEEFNHLAKVGELVLKGAFIGGSAAYLIASRRYNINKIVDLRKRMANERFFRYYPPHTVIPRDSHSLGPAKESPWGSFGMLFTTACSINLIIPETTQEQ